MITKITSSRHLLNRVYSDFRPGTSDWVGDAMEWISDALADIGASHQYEPAKEDLTVNNHRAFLPCDCISVLGVEYEGYKLFSAPHSAKPRRNNNFNNGLPVYTTSEEAYQNSLADGATSETVLGELEAKDLRHDVYYYLSPEMITTSFESGTITLYFLKVITDDEGFPMIPDEPHYREAIMFFIMMKMILGGYRHHTIDLKYAESKWQHHKRKAFAKANIPTLDQMETMKNGLVRLVKGFNLSTRFFQGGQSPQQFDDI